MEFEGLLSGQDLTKHNYYEKYVPSNGLKEFCPNNSWLEAKQIENQLEDDYNFIKANNIERESNISHAQWISHLNKAKVTKKVGKCWESLGHHQDNEDWLLPEEALFLVENCELLLFCDDVPVSIEDCYKLIINEGCVSWDEFRVFSHLSRAGFIVVRHSQSVSVTRYEQQVRLDAIVQNQKRSPPETSNDVTIIEDDDISIIEITPSTKTVNNKPLKNTIVPQDKLKMLSNESENIVIIESDDEVKEIDSDSDSDIICISSPSYIPDKNSREWYPSLAKALKRTVEKIIDLCDEEKYNESKYNIRNLIDLIRPSKAEILSHVPSVVQNDSNYKFKPDKRLLPPNVVPKYSEYSFNLHITSDDTDFSGYAERIPFGPPDIQTEMNFSGPRNFNNMDMNQIIQNNPLLMKAQQMQAMAMDMMQSAQTLMSVMTSAMQNPNELWQLMSNQLPSVTPFGTQRFAPPNNEFRPYGGFPRRPRPFSGRFPRRRFPYNRRPWYGRRQYTPQQCIAEKPASPDTSNDVVILSDEDDEADDKRNIMREKHVDSESIRKRKMNAALELSKRLKVEGDNDSTSTSLSGISICPAESTCEDVKKEPTDLLTNETIKKEPDAKVKSEPKESASSSELKESTGAFESSAECLKQLPVKSEKNQELSPVTLREINNLIKSEELGVSTSNGNQENKRNRLEPEVVDVLNSPSNSSRIISTINPEPLIPAHSNPANPEVLTRQPEITPCSSKDVSDMAENSQATTEVNDSERSSGLATTWEQYKNDFDDSMTKFDQCVSFGDILSKLRIFKPIDVCKINKKLKISYDMYLQEGRFKKSLKVLPDFRIIILRATDNLPTSVDIAGLKKQYQDNIYFLFSIVFDDTIGFYLYDSVTLSTLV